MIKIISFLSFVFLAATISLYLFWYKPKFSDTGKQPSVSRMPENSHIKPVRLQRMVNEMKQIDTWSHFNKQYCFLIDMSIHSGRNRFFIYNLLKDTVIAAGLVTQGSCPGANKSEKPFSNRVSSNCTSLGRYRVGKPYVGKFGLAYKLYGLDTSNSRAFERFVVLHAHGCVPDSEVFPLPICESWGCPTVSPAFLKILSNYIAGSTKPILMWIYY